MNLHLKKSGSHVAALATAATPPTTTTNDNCQSGDAARLLIQFRVLVLLLWFAFACVRAARCFRIIRIFSLALPRLRPTWLRNNCSPSAGSAAPATTVRWPPGDHALRACHPPRRRSECVLCGGVCLSLLLRASFASFVVDGNRHFRVGCTRD